MENETDLIFTEIENSPELKNLPKTEKETIKELLKNSIKKSDLR